jgi:hypothetical protein
MTEQIARYCQHVNKHWTIVADFLLCWCPKYQRGVKALETYGPENGAKKKNETHPSCRRIMKTNALRRGEHGRELASPPPPGNYFKYL